MAEQKTMEAPAKAQWSYEGDTGPDNWGTLDPAYAVCTIGRKQSPIDIPATTTASPFKTIEVHYQNTPLHIENNGHSIEIEYTPGSSLTLDGKRYELTQFHFHCPGEHTINGEQFALGAHFVHRASDKDLAVIGLVFREGAENAFLAKLWDKMPTQKGKLAFNQTVNAADLFPTAKQYYTYEGSLTTPGCDEIVRWLIFKNPVSVSKEQVAKFVALIGRNARPVQPLNGRKVGSGWF